MKHWLIVGIVLCCGNPLIADMADVSNQTVSAESMPKKERRRIFRVDWRMGLIHFTGHRAFNKYNEEVLRKDPVYGTAEWPRFTMVFNPQTIWKPVFGMGMGLLFYQGDSRRGYQDGRSVKVEVSGTMAEAGFKLGFRPGLDWVLAFFEVGTGLMLSERVTVTHAYGENNFPYDDRLIVPLVSFGGQVTVWKGFYGEGLITTGLSAVDDEMILAGVGYAF